MIKPSSSFQKENTDSEILRQKSLYTDKLIKESRYMHKKTDHDYTKFMANAVVLNTQTLKNLKNSSKSFNSRNHSPIFRLLCLCMRD